MGNGFGPGWDSAQIKISRSVHCSLVSMFDSKQPTKQSAVALQCSPRHPRDIGKIGQTPVVTHIRARRVEHAPDAARQERNA